MSGIALCTSDSSLVKFLDTISRRVGKEPTVVSQPDQAIRTLGELQPAIVLLDEQFSPGATLELASNLLTFLPNTKIILLLRSHGFDAVREAMRLGLTDALLVPDELDRLPDILTRLQHNQGVSATTGRVVAFFRAKGGAGATFLAVNIAMVATAIVEGQVLLIDGNMLTGDVSAMLDLKGPRTIVDLAPVLDELTPRHIQDVCAIHESGLHVLLAPPEPALSHVLGAEHLARIVRVAQRSYRAVIIDCPPLHDERCLALLGVATRPLLVTTADAPSIFAWRRMYPLVGNMGGRAGLVINQSTPKVEFGVKELTEWMQLRLAGEVRLDPSLAMPLANTGKSLLDLKGGRSLIARPPGLVKDVARLAKQLLA